MEDQEALRRTASEESDSSSVDHGPFKLAFGVDSSIEEIPVLQRTLAQEIAYAKGFGAEPYALLASDLSAAFSVKYGFEWAPDAQVVAHWVRMTGAEMQLGEFLEWVTEDVDCGFNQGDSRFQDAYFAVAQRSELFRGQNIAGGICAGLCTSFRGRDRLALALKIREHGLAAACAHLEPGIITAQLSQTPEANRPRGALQLLCLGYADHGCAGWGGSQSWRAIFRHLLEEHSGWVQPLALRMKEAVGGGLGAGDLETLATEVCRITFHRGLMREGRIEFPEWVDAGALEYWRGKIRSDIVADAEEVPAILEELLDQDEDEEDDDQVYGPLHADLRRAIDGELDAGEEARLLAEVHAAAMEGSDQITPEATLRMALGCDDRWEVLQRLVTDHPELFEAFDPEDWDEPPYQSGAALLQAMRDALQDRPADVADLLYWVELVYSDAQDDDSEELDLDDTDDAGPVQVSASVESTQTHRGYSSLSEFLEAVAGAIAEACDAAQTAGHEAVDHVIQLGRSEGGSGHVADLEIRWVGEGVRIFVFDPNSGAFHFTVATGGQRLSRAAFLQQIQASNPFRKNMPRVWIEDMDEVLVGTLTI